MSLLSEHVLIVRVFFKFFSAIYLQQSKYFENNAQFGHPCCTINVMGVICLAGACSYSFVLFSYLFHIYLCFFSYDTCVVVFSNSAWFFHYSEGEVGKGDVPRCGSQYRWRPSLIQGSAVCFNWCSAESSESHGERDDIKGHRMGKFTSERCKWPVNNDTLKINLILSMTRTFLLRTHST